ncbi:MAG: hybrid sensor histidine kinase/response regulator [Syntrophaceae bacterium]|nr:hybrid sensor histidine kinase/response regulator [Syntrophaceae bacterium]
MPEMKDLIAIFKAETEEHLTKLDNGLVELEKQPDNVDLVTSLNREVHTLKGAARVFGFCEIQDIAHRIEDIFEEVAAKRAVFSSFIAEKIFEGLDAIRTILARIVQEGAIDIDVSEICRELEACITGTEGLRPQKKPEEQARGEEEVSKTQFRAVDTSEKEAREKTRERVMDRFKEVGAPPLSGQVEEYIRVPLSRVDKLLYLVGEVVVNKMKASAVSAQVKRLSKLSREVQKSISGLSEAMKRDLPSQNGEIAKWLSQCDALVQKLREHTIKLYDEVSTEAFHLDPVIDELQARMKEMKMLPLSTIVEGFPRMVRDIASQQGKEVNLVIFGEETELDKKVLEGIKTSLIHLLRNCIDHGIEEPELRMLLGKPRYGTIKISASHEAGNVVITVEDDGRGMDIDQIRQTALNKGLLSSHDLEQMTEKEILNIVFMNGYSTSPVVTDVSGRGMGLDIVRRDITNLKGQVTLDTQKSKGTRFTLVLPLTIAIIQVLLVKVQNMPFAIPMLSITETVKVNMDEVATIEGRMAIHFREEILPLVRLSEVLELPATSREEEKVKKEVPVVILTYLDRRVGFIVDEIVGEEEVFIKGLGKHLGKVKNVSGAMIMASGEVVVVLDTADLIAHSALSLRLSREKPRTDRRKRKETRILIVEDAFSARELEKSILETHGYVVDTAVDGLDALNRMAGTRYDLIVSDVEMPRMDGFELCRTLKKKEGYKDIPIVMVTSLEKEEDKRRGMEAGASAYIVKSAFEQTNLLDTIQRLVG